MNKPDLFYSKYCEHSKIILEELNKNGFHEKFNYICIDKRVIEKNIIYIFNQQGEKRQLPPMINRVPVLLLKPNYEILSGNQILDYIKPQSKTIEEEEKNVYNEPNSFNIGMNHSLSGVSSDRFSFIDSTSEELSAKGNAGIRQMYHYSSFDNYEEDYIPTPLENDKKPKINMNLEQLQEKRNNELKYNK